MTVQAMSLFFALLAVGANLVVLGAVAAWLLRGVPAVEQARAAATEELRPYALGLAALVATVAMAGSVYYSEGAGFVPCLLCWIQRGFMYPLAAGLLVAAWRRFWPLRRGARLWALAGAVVSTWHVLVQRFPGLEGSTVCDPNNPCALTWVRELGFITIPYMALSAFLLVAVLLSITPSDEQAAEDDADTDVETTETR